MAFTGIRRLIRAAAKDPSLLGLIKSNPKKLATRFKLKRDELFALRSADRLLVLRGLLAKTVTFTFTTGSTITASLGRVRIGPKTQLKDIFKK